MKYGLIAERVGHSFSAEIHKELFGYDYELKAIPKDKLESFMTEREFCAINVTIPYKEAVIPFLDEIDKTAFEIGAVNTVVNQSGKLYGYNTDLAGLIALINKADISLKDKKVLILGSGGTSKTALYAAKKLGASFVARVSRNEKDQCITYENALKEHNNADVIINTTPSGMFPNIGESAIDINAFQNLSGVVDAVYNPLRSKLVCDALKRNIKATGGLYMLVAQAAFAAEKFVGKSVSEDRIHEIYNQLYRSKENIVLVGMPGSGKTTVGKLLSDKTGMELLDTDVLITNKIGKTPDELIKTKGETAFRDIESEIVLQVSKLQNKIIATGGGAILREKNCDLLRENGRVYFLDRPIEDIIPTSDRPLSSNRALLQQRYNERYPIYCRCADVRIHSVKNANECMNVILEDFLI